MENVFRSLVEEALTASLYDEAWCVFCKLMAPDHKADCWTIRARQALDSE